jgi:ornithine carbamoyltransferase
MANSWIEVASVLGFSLRLACPKAYMPDRVVLDKALKADGSKVSLAKTPMEAAKDADVLNTDVWASMGQEKEIRKRKTAFKGYRIDARVLSVAKKDSVVMHCLPAHRGEEITEDVIEGPNSVVWDQAENRLHMQKAVLEWLLAEGVG